MAQGKYAELSVAQRSDVWRRWKAGESLHAIGRAVDRPHTSIHCLLAHQGVRRLGQEACASLTDQSRVTMIFLKLAGFSLHDRRASAAPSSGTTRLTA